MEVFEAAASSSSTWRGIMDSCSKICLNFQGVVDCDSVLILHRSTWRCLVRTYSTVIDSLTKQVEKASSNSGQKLLVSLNALHHAMQEGERCFEDCICKISEINHSWLIDKALKVSMSSDIVDVHLHDFIWAYATVKVQALWLGIHFECMELPDLFEETSNLCKIWAAEDAKEDLHTAQVQLQTNSMGTGEEETLLLAKFIVDKLIHTVEDKAHCKLTHTIEDKVHAEAYHVLPGFLWVDQTSLKRTSDSNIGKGSFGIVYEAMWLTGLFAVKQIFYQEEAALSGREQVIQARMRHPNVINLVCCTKDPSRESLSLVMELMQQDLRLFMKGRKKDGIDPPFTLLEAIDLMLQVSKGMEYLHSLNIMHRDLKSSNILVSLPPISNHHQIHHHTHIKIADFGNAKAKELSSYFTTKPTGTLSWRAPEVFKDQGSDGHTRYRKTADVYSFGLVCYEILTGELPFKETQNLYKRVMGGERPNLPNYCPRALKSYIKRCWDGNPNARPSFTCICRMLRYFKACILLEDSHDYPNAWLAHPVSSRACARITDMGQSQDSLISAFPRPLNILREMHWCRIVLQESNEDPESSTREGWSITRLFNEISRNYKVWMRLTISQGKMAFDVPSGSIREKAEQMPKIVWTHVTGEYPDLQPEAKNVTFMELQVATDNFNERNKLGSGRVYKGTLTSGRVVAVKMLASYSCTWDQFQSEINLIKVVRHRNLIQLLGYCAEDSKGLLVYEFLRLGSLDRFIFDPSCEALHWAVRINIIKGVAKGLCYLHDVKIVHTHIKSSNILLEETMNPKITDFGLANVSSTNNIVVGTYGYAAPESGYSYSRQLTEKANIYSFGIVILEIVSGQKAFQQSLGLLRDWAWSLFENGEEMQLLDQRIANTGVREDAVKEVVRVALLCSGNVADERPSMAQVCTMLSK